MHDALVWSLALAGIVLLNCDAGPWLSSQWYEEAKQAAAEHRAVASVDGPISMSLYDNILLESDRLCDRGKLEVAQEIFAEMGGGGGFREEDGKGMHVAVFRVRRFHVGVHSELVDAFVLVLLHMHSDGVDAGLEGARPHEGQVEGARGEGRHRTTYHCRRRGGSSAGQVGMQEYSGFLHSHHARQGAMAVVSWDVSGDIAAAPMACRGVKGDPKLRGV